MEVPMRSLTDSVLLVVFEILYYYFTKQYKSSLLVKSIQILQFILYSFLNVCTYFFANNKNVAMYTAILYPCMYSVYLGY